MVVPRSLPTSHRFGSVTARTLALAVVTLALTSLLADQAPLLAQSVSQVINYAPSDEDFPNPERGFYYQRLPFALGTRREPLRAEQLTRFRREGVSLIRTYFIIDEFRETPLSQDALDQLAADLLAVRRAGLKIIPRFTYNFPSNTNRTLPDDASLERVLSHIDQLEPLLRTNGDIIAFFEMGFVGAWGEWHSSSHRLVNADRTTNADTATLVDRVLRALPMNRFAALRYPFHKQALFGPEPVDLSTAFNGSPRSRIGAHNDCFGSDETNGGTYVALPGQSQDIASFKAYLRMDNQFVPQGGESCGTDVAANAADLPYMHCPASLQELSAMRWSTLNIGYHPAVIRTWQREGCFDEIRRRLGYRLKLIHAELPVDAVRGAVFHAQVTLTNDGWAAPYNPRLAQLVLRHTSTGALQTFPLKTDPRLWASGQTQTLTLDETLPLTLDPGDYEVLFDLPDPEPALYRLPAYSIRLANAWVWEASTGFNSLLARVRIEP